MNRAKKEQLKELVEKLDPQEHAQIFAIIKKYTNVYTQTQSGVLVSSDNLPPKCFEEIEALVRFYVDQRSRMEVDAAERKALERR